MKNIKAVRIVSLIIALCLIIGCCGCTAGIAASRPVIAGKEGAQYVIALNPSIAFEDTTVNSIRNSLSSSLQADMSSGKVESLYTGTAWRWLTHSSDGSWNTRKLRAVTMWMNSEGLTNNGVPYAYTVTDSGLSSLAVYDATKMDVKGVNSGELPQSGVIMSFTGEAEEGITFISDKDCIAELADRSLGNVAVVSSISGLGTDFTALEGAKKAIVLRIYKNNRIYWQEVLEAGSTAVSFPTFTRLELKAGDIISITAQAMDDTSAIIRGNCDLPATTATVIEKIPNETKVEDVKITGIPFIDEDGYPQFTIVRSATATVSELQVIKSLYDGMVKNLDTDVEYKTDAVETQGRRILIYSVNDPAAKKVMSEVKAGRKQNYTDFIIRLVGEDVVIAAVTEMGLQMAVDFFLNNYCTAEDSEVPLELDYVSSDYNPIKNITLAGTPASRFRIVVSHTASFMETSAANELSEELTRLCGSLIPVVEDDASAKQDYEIVIGDSNRANYRGKSAHNTSAKDADVLVDAKASNYEIKVDSKRTTVLADHISGVNAGVLKLISLVKSNNSVEKGTVTGKYDGEYSLLDGYKLTFADEFDGDTLKNYWSTYGLLGDASKNWTGGTTKTNRPTVGGGNLVNTVTWKRNSDDTVDINHSEMRSHGRNTMNYMWGYTEIRIKWAKSWGLTHSMFTQATGGTNGFLEANIIETFGDPYNCKFNMHTWAPSGHINHNAQGASSILNNSPGVTCEEGFGQEYHTFGWEWTDDWSQFYCDGKKTWYFEHKNSSFDLFDKPCWLVLSFRSSYYAGGAQPEGYGGTHLEKNPFFMDETMDFYSDTALVDYVHIYQKDNGSVMYIKQ